MVKRDAQGRLYTVADPAPIDLPKARRECHDRVAGNEQFHDDPFTPRTQPEAEPPHALCECIAGFYLCDWCSRDA